MKQNIQIIQNIVNKDFIQTIKQIQINAVKYNFPNLVGDGDIAELQEKLETVAIFLSKQKNLLIIDNYTRTKRDLILNNITNISNHIGGITNGSNNLPSILTRTESIYDIIYPDLIISKDLGDYNQENANLKQLKKEYISATKDLLKLLENKNLASEFAKIIPDVQTKLQTSEASYQRIRELEQVIEQKRDNIVGFSEEIDNYKATFQETEKSYSDLSIKNQEETDILINSNKELHTKVADLLSSTIGGKSSEKLKERADKISYGWRVAGIILTTISIGISSYFVYKMIDLGTDTTGKIIVKYLFISPLIVLDIFFTTQYISAKKLKEEYEFKAIISGTLETYINLLNDNDNRREHKDFITTTANRIFASPI